MLKYVSLLICSIFLLGTISCGASGQHLTSERVSEISLEKTVHDMFTERGESSAFCEVRGQKFYYVDKKEAALYPQYCTVMPPVANVRCLTPRKRLDDNKARMACLVFLADGHTSVHVEK